MWQIFALICMAAEGTGGGGSGGEAGAGAGAAAGGAGAGAGSGQAGQAGGAGAGGGAPPVFAETLPEDIRGDAAFRDIRDLPTLAKSYLHAQKLIGRDPGTLLALPGPDDEVAWNGVYDRLGRPAAPDQYKLGEVKLPDGVQADDRLRGQFLATSHKAGLTTKQADALYQWYQAEVITQHTSGEQARQQQIVAGEQTLKTEWGQAFEQNMAMATQALQHYAEPGLVEHLEKTGLGNDPAMVRLFAKLGKQLQEDGGLKGGSGNARGDVRSPAEAQQEIASLYNGSDPAWLKTFQDKAAPGHQEAVARMQRLHDMAYPAPV